MTANISLEQLKKALFQSNNALKKRALAIIHNDTVVEAQEILRQFLGEEEDPSLQAMGLRVLHKLVEFALESGKASTESLIPLLKSPDFSRRILALRGMVGRQSETIPGLIQKYCAKEELPEAQLLIIEILRSNPHISNYPLIKTFLKHPSAKIRIEAFRALSAMFAGAILPEFIQGLKDSAPEVQLLARQTLIQLNRKHIVDALNFLLDGQSVQQSRLAAAVIPSLVAPDLFDLIRKHLNHPDRETAALIKDAARFASEKLGADLLFVIPQDRVLTAESDGSHPLIEIASQLREVWEQAPLLFMEPLTDLSTGSSATQIISAIKSVYERVVDFLTISFLLVYFVRGEQNPGGSRICFRAIQQEFANLNTVQFLKLLSNRFPAPYGGSDLFPLLLGYRIRNDSDDEVLEPLVSLHEGFNLLEDYPDEAENFLEPAIQGLVDLFSSLQPFLAQNQIVGKTASSGGMKVFNYWAPVPIACDVKKLGNFFLPLNKPVLISRDSVHSISLETFYKISPGNRLIRHSPTEEELWDFLKQFGEPQAYLGFLASSGG